MTSPKASGCPAPSIAPTDSTGAIYLHLPAWHGWLLRLRYAYDRLQGADFTSVSVLNEYGDELIASAAPSVNTVLYHYGADVLGLAGLGAHRPDWCTWDLIAPDVIIDIARRKLMAVADEREGNEDRTLRTVFGDADEDFCRAVTSC